MRSLLAGKRKDVPALAAEPRVDLSTPRAMIPLTWGSGLDSRYNGLAYAMTVRLAHKHAQNFPRLEQTMYDPFENYDFLWDDLWIDRDTGDEHTEMLELAPALVYGWLF